MILLIFSINDSAVFATSISDSTCAFNEELTKSVVIHGIPKAIASNNLFCNPVPINKGAMNILAEQ